MSVHICFHQVLLFVSSVLFSHCRYNKRDFDFPSLRDYNDYLEQVEDIGRCRVLEAGLRLGRRGRRLVGCLLPVY